MNYKHECIEENADRFWEWTQKRGGVAIWQSINLSNPGASWSTPAKTESGEPMSKPTWEAASAPKLIVTNPAEIKIYGEKEVRRFHVAVRRSGNGLAFKCTDASTKKIRKAVDRAGESAFYKFDYMSQEAVIFMPEGERSLLEWAREKGLTS